MLSLTIRRPAYSSTVSIGGENPMLGGEVVSRARGRDKSVGQSMSVCMVGYLILDCRGGDVLLSDSEAVSCTLYIEVLQSMGLDHLDVTSRGMNASLGMLSVVHISILSQCMPSTPIHA